MIKRITSCPYCGQGEVAFDCDTMDLVLNPDGVRQEPCTHLISIQGYFSCARVTPDGSTKAGYAKVQWQHPELSTVSPDSVYQQMQDQATAAENAHLPPRDRLCCIEPVRWEVAERFSPAETVRWLDEIGWDQAENMETPYMEAQLDVWVGFARYPTDLVRVAC